MEKLTPRDTGKGLAETFTGDVYITTSSLLSGRRGWSPAVLW